MAHTIKISGLSDELLSRVDERWKGRHYADRSEYVRDLIRKDVLEEAPSFSEGIRSLFRGLRDNETHIELSEEEIAADVEEAVSEVRLDRRKNSRQSG
jgi:Arc/MetJ-type ribon-helix-helix transcriptional regulator